MKKKLKKTGKVKESRKVVLYESSSCGGYLICNGGGGYGGCTIHYTECYCN